VDDISMLIRIAKISNILNAPFVSYLNMEIVDKTSLTGTIRSNNLIFEGNSQEAKLWNTIRSIPEAESIGLLIQQLLIRLPYSAKTEPIEKFSFEEFSDPASHEDYLWTNPSFAFALLLAQSFSLFNWRLEETSFQDIEGLPILLHDDVGKNEIKSSSEFFLTEQLCEDILMLGLMPIISYRNSDTIRPAQIQSISFPRKSLKGKWN
jgi:type VI secretion system protein ImpC